MNNPIPRKINENRIIYESRGLQIPNKTGPPVLCDFGEARSGSSSYTDDIQPYVYRAPEVILDIPWSYEVDIWNVGVMVQHIVSPLSIKIETKISQTWTLFEGRHLFHARGPKGDRLSEYHLAEMVAVLGVPPVEYLRRTETSQKYFNDDGTWNATAAIPENYSLETLENRLSGENKTSFLAFMRKILQWCPERRCTAEQLLDDAWLNS